MWVQGLEDDDNRTTQDRTDKDQDQGQTTTDTIRPTRQVVSGTGHMERFPSACPRQANKPGRLAEANTLSKYFSTYVIVVGGYVVS